MLNLSLSRGLLFQATALGFILSNFAMTRIAIAVPELPSQVKATEKNVESNVQETEAAEAPAEPTDLEDGAIEAKNQPKSVKFQGDGNPYFFENADLTMTPPTSWDVETHVGGVTAIMEAPKVEIEKDGEKTLYRRNITVAVIHEASPIDQWRAKEVQESMMAKYSKDGLVKDFQILEHKFFDFRGKNDGLLIYTSLLIDETPLMQMHLLVSGSEKQYLMSYTDLADSFTDQANGRFEEAWNTMTAITIKGVAPTRVEQWSKYAIIAGCLLLVCLIIAVFRRRARKHNYQDEADQLYADSLEGDADDSSSIMATLAFGWKLDRKHVNGGDDDFYGDDDLYGEDDTAPVRSAVRTLPQTKLPQTKLASELSNF